MPTYVGTARAVVHNLFTIIRKKTIDFSFIIWYNISVRKRGYYYGKGKKVFQYHRKLQV